MPQPNDNSMQDLKPTVWIGKQGCTETMIEEIVSQLKKRKLIKVKWLQNTEVDPEAIAVQAKARLVEVRGRTMVLSDKGRAPGVRDQRPGGRRKLPQRQNRELRWEPPPGRHPGLPQGPGRNPGQGRPEKQRQPPRPVPLPGPPPDLRPGPWQNPWAGCRRRRRQGMPGVQNRGEPVR